MKQEKDKSSSRRDWLNSVFRYGALAVLVGGVGELVLRSNRALPTGADDACRQSRCKTCRLVAHCDLSKATDWRAEQKRGGTS